jgi:hypothetical protein
MSIFELAVLLASLCGVIMVCGGLFLLGRGAITLAATPKTDAISIEFRKQFRIHTQVPGIALFLVGLMFVTQALYFSKPGDIVPIDLQGEVSGVVGPVTVIISTKWPVHTFTGGQIEGRIYPDMTSLIVEATAPGYLPFSAPVKLKTSPRRVAALGSLRLQKVLDEIPPNPANIRGLDFTAPPPGQGGSFGVPR